MSHLISLKWVYWYHWQQLQETLPLLPNLMKSFFWVYKYKGFLPENWPKKEKSVRRGVGETMRRFYSPEMIFKGTTLSCTCLQCGRPGFNPWVRKILWWRAWQPTPILLPGESHRRRSLIGYSPQGRRELDTTERLHFLSLSLSVYSCHLFLITS